jgi:hypothetical protein
MMYDPRGKNYRLNVSSYSLFVLNLPKLSGPVYALGHVWFTPTHLVASVAAPKLWWLESVPRLWRIF